MVSEDENQINFQKIKMVDQNTHDPWHRPKNIHRDFNLCVKTGFPFDVA